MTAQILYPSLKRRPPSLKAGWHTAELYGISEYNWPDGKEPCLKLEFKASNGIIHLLLPLSIYHKLLIVLLDNMLFKLYTIYTDY